MHHFFRLSVVCAVMIFSYGNAPALAIQTFSGGIVQGEKTLSDANLTQSGTVELSGTATYKNPLTAIVPFVNTGTLNPSLWATAPEIIVSLVQAEGDLSGGYSLSATNVNHNTFTLSIRPSKGGVSLRKIAISYIAIGRHS
jgi:hypothetical protein